MGECPGVDERLCPRTNLLYAVIIEGKSFSGFLSYG